MDLVRLVIGYGPVVGSCQHGNEPLRSIKGRDFLDKCSILSDSQELCPMVLTGQLLSWYNNNQSSEDGSIAITGISIIYIKYHFPQRMKNVRDTSITNSPVSRTFKESFITVFLNLCSTMEPSPLIL